MSAELPRGWAEITLQNAGAWRSGGTPSRRRPEFFGKGIPWVKSGDLPDGPILKTDEEITTLGLENSAAKLMPAGTISMALYGATIGKLGLMTFPAATNQACANVVPDTRLVEPQFLFNYLLSERRNFIEQGQGGAQPNISQEIVRSHPFPLAPLAEQRRIVAKLEKLLGQVDACQKRLDKMPTLLKRFRQSILAAACSGRLTADWREDDSEEDGFPVGWKTRRLDSLFTIRTGGTPSRKVSEYFQNGTIPWVKTGEVQNCDITTAEEFITEAAVENSNAKIFPAGTILVAMYGEGKTRGQIGRLMFPAATNQACAALINTELPEATRQYVFNFLLGQYFLLRAESVGGNQPNLNLSIVKQWEIALPPLAEQQEIVRRVAGLFALADQLEQRLAQARKQVDKLTPSLLARAFAGQLVPQNPADEPAEKLLERICSKPTKPQNHQTKDRK